MEGTTEQDLRAQIEAEVRAQLQAEGTNGSEPASPAPRRSNQTNVVVLTGNLTADPELRKTNSGQSVTTLRIGNTQLIRGVADANFLNVIVFGKAAEDCVAYCKTGREITVQGRLNQRTYKDVNSPQAKAAGQPIVRTVVEVVAQPFGIQWGFDPSFARRQAAAEDAAGEQAVEPAAQAAEPAATPDVEAQPEPVQPVTVAPDGEDIPF